MGRLVQNLWRNALALLTNNLLVLGAWCLVLGAWCLVLGAWCLVFGGSEFSLLIKKGDVKNHTTLFLKAKVYYGI